MDMKEEWLHGLCAWASNNGNVRELWLFGSRAIGRSEPGSDVDLAVLLMPHDWAFANYVALHMEWKEQLEAIVGRDVDFGAIGIGTELDEEVRRTGKLLWARSC